MRITAFFTALAAALTLASAAAAKTPVPTVSAPIPTTATSHPFGGAAFTLRPEDLAKSGYVEQEFLVSGKANVYDWPAPGPAVVRTADVPYTTRILVRRPINKRRFSGSVVVEMLNPSNRIDLNIGWAISREQIMRRGDAWVGITAKPVAVFALKRFDAERYRAVSWPNPLPLTDPRNCQNAGDGSRETENGLIWDINSQVGAWLRSGEASNPFNIRPGQPVVKHLYGWGYSQTGSFLATYIKAIHPLTVQADGRPMYDGYIVAVSGGRTPINQCAGAVPRGDDRSYLGNAGVPIMHIMSQSDYLNTVQGRRPDSDDPKDPFRFYDLAGAGHATPDELYYGPQPPDIVKAGNTPPPVACNEGDRSRFPSKVPFNAALRNLMDWAEKGIPAPRAKGILVADGRAVLDAHGNVQGGVRTPYLDVPTATWFGNATGASFCRIAGYEKPFAEEKLTALYPNKQAYVRAVERNVDDLVRQRFIVREDGEALKREARAFAWP